MSEATTAERKQLLTGKENYLGWKKVTTASLSSKGFIKNNVVVAGKEEDALNYIYQHLSLKIAGDLPTATAVATLDWLKSRYGDINRWDAEIDYKNTAMDGIDAAIFLAALDSALALVIHADGKIDYDVQLDTMLKGCHQEFYQDFIRQMRKEYKDSVTTQETLDAVRKEMLLHFKATPPEIRAKFTSRHAGGRANNVAGIPKRPFAKRHCDICAVEKPRVAHTHDTAYHRGPREANSVGGNAHRVDDANKQVEAYFDTGADKHYFRSKPDNYQPGCFGEVVTAGGEVHRIVGKGSVRFGNTTIAPVFHVPSFDINLVAATPILKAGGTAVLSKRSLTIVDKEDKPMFTGLVKNGLIKFGSANAVKVSNGMDLHQRFGHANKQMIMNTLKATTAPDDFIRTAKSMEEINCENCIIGKRRKQNIPKKRSSEQRDVLHEIQIDLQGPLPALDHSGNCSNIKFVDRKSGYIKFETLSTKTASEVSEAFKRFQARMERRTGKKIKTVLVDGGTEFDGDFVSHCENSGIIKQRGAPYRHHVPPQGEKAHEVINTGAKPLLLASNLPRKYYSLAQAFKTYVHNRTVHSGHLITPYEYIYGVKPEISNFHQFGCICYAYIPAEKRRKLDPVREKCRLVGYGDDDDTEEFKGYYLLCESDLSLIYADDVVFDDSAEMAELPNSSAWNGEGVLFREVGLEDSEDYSPTTPSNPSSTGTLHNHETDFNDSNSVTSEELNDQLAYLQNQPWYQEDGHAYTATTTVQIPLPSLATPKTFLEALNSPQKLQWVAAMKKEIEALKENGTWDKMKLPQGRKAVKSKWVYRIKTNENGNVTKFKARLVAKGFTQIAGVDFKETFAPTAKLKSVRVLTALAAKKTWKIWQDDVPAAYLKSEIKEEVFMELPAYWNLLEDEAQLDWDKNQKDLLEQYQQKPEVVKLIKTLYGLKQSGNEWNKTLHQYLVSKEFTRSTQDHCIYWKVANGKWVIVGVYVDDILTTGDADDVSSFRMDLHQRFGMEPGGILNWYLGINVQFSNDDNGSSKITLDQDQYLKEKLIEFEEFIGTGGTATPLPSNFQSILDSADDEEDPKFPYREMVGSLMYAMVGTRPDLAFPLQVVCQYMQAPKRVHCQLVRHIFKYCRFNSYALEYSSENDMILRGWSDASYANNQDFKSTGGSCFKLGGSLLSWSSNKQNIVALSTAESELIALTAAAQEAIWMQTLLAELGFPQVPTTIFEDNQACIALAKNPQNHKRTKGF